MAKTTTTKAIAAAQEAGRNAAHDWEPGGISNSDHRLRSLMNFERDVVKSTWDDTEALPLWNAFLQAYDKASALESGEATCASAALRKMVATGQKEAMLNALEQLSARNCELLIAVATRMVATERKEKALAAFHTGEITSEELIHIAGGVA